MQREPGAPADRAAANFVLNNPSSLDVATNPDGTVSLVTVYGGGWGHNLGMSQYGAHGRGKHGQTFIEILKAYYTGVDISPWLVPGLNVVQYNPVGRTGTATVNVVVQ